jgi:hypothetical protein
MLSILLIIHVSAGYIGLLTALGAMSVKTFGFKHVWHIRFGKVFFWSMMVVAISAIPLSLYVENIFLLLIAVFSAYLTHGGWRYSQNHTGAIRAIDRFSIYLAMLTGVSMLLYGLYMLMIKDSQGITLSIFGAILLAYSLRELKFFKKEKLENNQRIAMHLSHMLAATIASITAFVVTNITFEPIFLLWLSPSIIITPLIVYWNIKLLRQ